MSALKTDIADLAEAIRSARHVAALTGAGVSTLSGIADFRSPNQPIWERFEITRVFDIEEFERDPNYFHAFAHEVISTFDEARPSAVHTLLARMEHAGLLQTVATQNIDGLHQAAGSQRVYELHGGVEHGHCLGCGRTLDAAELHAHFTRPPPAPPCTACGGVLKPDIVFYGEMLPMEALGAAMAEARRADLYLAIGSSLVVYPAAQLPVMTAQTGGRLAIVTRDPTPLDGIASFLIRDDLGEVADRLAKALGLDA